METHLRKRLQRQLMEWEAGEFHYAELYGPAWETLWIGDRVKSGRAFLNAVRKGEFPGVIDLGKRDGGRCYRWLGADEATLVLPCES